VSSLEALGQRFHLFLDEHFEGLKAMTRVFFQVLMLLEQTFLQASELFVRIPHHRTE
jgi:hypothetical protein